MLQSRRRSVPFFLLPLIGHRTSILRTLTTTALLLLGATCANAGSVTWTLNNMNFGVIDPVRLAGSASGSLLFDAATGIISDWSITSTDASFSSEMFGGYSYTPSTSVASFRPSDGLFWLISNDNQHQFYFGHGGAGLLGTTSFSVNPTMFATAEYNFLAHANPHTYRIAVSGTLDPAAEAPEPVSSGLGAGGLLLMALYLKRQRTLQPGGHLQ